jgi:hypothetical protein
MQRTPAGLPFGMPGIAEEILGAIQQAPQLKRHSISYPILHEDVSLGFTTNHDIYKRLRKLPLIVLGVKISCFLMV